MHKSLLMFAFTTAFLTIGSSFVSAQNDMSDKMNKNDKKMDSKMMMPSASDTEFANMAAMGGQAEIQMAELAMQKSTSKAVKKYASKMMKDHMKAGKNLDKIAAKKNMTLSKTPNEEQMQMMSQLQQASGTEFDRMYIQMAGVEAHQKMKTLFQTEASGGSDKDLKSFAAKTLPVVQMHLQMAQQMANGGTKTNNASMKGM
ncbi:MAG: DUF4142 domain-containing protein [Acidobacteria bacterium]|nr:DUF4142 domain-containing protein [Acidobacteriota bacterium]MCA1637829.1 DUF4142 domain-containing protein [Acidobacteriota bacterium]